MLYFMILCIFSSALKVISVLYFILTLFNLYCLLLFITSARRFCDWATLLDGKSVPLFVCDNGDLTEVWNAF